MDIPWIESCKAKRLEVKGKVIYINLKKKLLEPLSFLSSGAPKFTEERQKPYLAEEGANVTLKWRYTFSEKESFRRATFLMGSIDIAEKSARDSTPFIIPPYRDRLHVTVTNNYTSITLMGVNRLDTGSYALTVSTYPNGAQRKSTSEISVVCKYKNL